MTRPLSPAVIAEIRRAAREHAEQAPPLTPEQKADLRRLFAPVVAKLRVEAAAKQAQPDPVQEPEQ